MAPRVEKRIPSHLGSQFASETLNTPTELYYPLLSDTVTHHQSCYLAAEGVLPIVNL